MSMRATKTERKKERKERKKGVGKKAHLCDQHDGFLARDFREQGGRCCGSLLGHFCGAVLGSVLGHQASKVLQQAATTTIVSKSLRWEKKKEEETKQQRTIEGRGKKERRKNLLLLAQGDEQAQVLQQIVHVGLARLLGNATLEPEGITTTFSVGDQKYGKRSSPTKRGGGRRGG